MTTTGIDFRGTSGYITDPSGCTYCIGDSYPTTRGGLTFGWGAGASVADRSTSVNARVAGINYVTPGNSITFRVDLPASGQYSIGVAQGDAGSARTLQSFTIYDNTTSLLSQSANEGGHLNYYMDAAGNVWTSDSAWFSSQVFESLTFASTIFKITIGNSTDYNTLAHLDITAAGGTQYNQTCAATGNATASMTREVSKIIQATGNVTGFLTRQTSKPLTATANATASLVRQTNKLLAATANATSKLFGNGVQLGLNTLIRLLALLGSGN